MKHLFFLTLITFLLVGCQNRHKPTLEEIMAEEWLSDTQMEDSTEKAKKEEEGEKLLESKEKSTTVQTKKRSSRYHSYDEYETDDDAIESNDNLRGYDPASEDDMEDNGMSRYMDNNDEGGWY